jgi:predicted  nucleic acid-binding Zn-ribbon protein
MGRRTERLKEEYIQSKKKVLVCEHCGRILVPTEEAEA